MNWDEKGDFHRKDEGEDTNSKRSLSVPPSDSPLIRALEEHIAKYYPLPSESLEMKGTNNECKESS